MKGKTSWFSAVVFVVLPLLASMAQDFFAAFGHDGVGTVGTDTTITSTDMDGILMIAAQALEKRTDALRAENAELKTRLELLERRLGTDTLTRAE